MSVKELISNMIETLTTALPDADKHDKGNSAAGTRVRKALQSVKAAAQEVRVKVQNEKNSR